MAGLDHHRQAITRLLLEREALRFGDFLLKSGRRSPYFVNLGTLHRGGDLALLGQAYAALLAESVDPARIHTVFGPAYKGIPLALATAQALEEQLERPVDWCFDRKEIKNHGERSGLVGAPLERAEGVVVVDDVLTAGTALRTCLGHLAELGVTPLAAAVLVDREERGPGGGPARSEIASQTGVPVVALLGIRDTVARLAGRGLDPALAERIRTHLDEA